MKIEEEEFDLYEIADSLMTRFDMEFELFQSYLKQMEKFDVEWLAMDNDFYEHLGKMHRSINSIGIIYKELSKEKPPIEIILFARYYHSQHLFVMFSKMNSIKNCVMNYNKEVKRRKRNEDERNLFNDLGGILESYESKHLKEYEALKNKPFDIESVTERSKAVVNEFNNVCEIMVKAYEIVREYYIYDGNMLDIMKADFDEKEKKDEINSLLYEYVMDMVRKMESDEYVKLKRQVVLVKEKRSDKVTEEHWCRLLELEERALKMAAKGELKSCEDEIINEMYNEEERELMDKESGAIERMLDIFTDDELFLFGKMNKRGGGRPNRKNVEMIARLMLRGNIIRSEMNAEVKRMYEKWMGREVCEEVCAERVKEEENVLKSDKVMWMWKRLQAAGLVDEELMPTVSNPKAAIIASVMSDLLRLEPRWRAFEELWDIDDLANKLTRAQNADYYDSFLKEVENLLK